MKKAYFLSFLAAAGLGTVWHYLYELFPVPLTALLCPVNESVWEHLKLLFFPSLAVALFLDLRFSGPQRNFWSAVCFSALLGPLVLTCTFYTLTAGFGIRPLPGFDVPLYYVCLAIAWLFAYRLSRSGAAARYLGALVIGAGVFGAALIVFTIAAPPLPIFLPPFS